MLIFDIGCNKGEFIKVCLKNFDKPKIIAVDANIDMITHCKYKFPMNSNIEYQFVLMSDHIGIEEFYVSFEDGISTASKKWMTESRFARGNAFLHRKSMWDPFPRKIGTLTLDRLIELYGKPDLVKIDVEGYEYKVISGLSEKIGEIQFEWAEEEKENILKCINHLQSLGYDEFGIRGFIIDDRNLENVTYDSGGDTHLKQPEYYGKWEDFDFDSICKTKRRLNWGMIHAR